MSRTNLSAALAVAALLVSPVACSRDDTATSPQLSPSAMFSSAEFDADGDGHLSDAEKAAKEAAHDAKKAAKKLTEAERKAAKEAEKRAFEALRHEWRAYKDSVKKGLVHATILRCEPRPRDSETKRIGPKGGELRVGPHTLFIPAGALDREVEITGTTQTGARREIEFEPHGLEFRGPVRLTMSFDKCIVPATEDVLIVYTGPGNQIVARQPSLADKVLKTVDGWTDHFSGYAVAHGFDSEQ